MKIGSPFEEDVLCGPVHTKGSIEIYKKALAQVERDGGETVYGGEVVESLPGNYVVPTITRVPADASIMQDESFVPILHVTKFRVFLL